MIGDQGAHPSAPWLAADVAVAASFIVAACSKAASPDLQAAATVGMPPIASVQAAATVGASSIASAEHSAVASEPTKFDVSFTSGPNTLKGWVVRSAQRPAPTIVYNHGSGRNVAYEAFADVARWFASRGYVVFFPFRRGCGGSEGRYFEDEVEPIGSDGRDRQVVDHLVAENEDVSAAVAWIATQSYVDPRRIAMMGCSFGGIEALFAAELTPSIYAAVDFAGASNTWRSSPVLRERMMAAAQNTRVPTMFVQANNDFDLTPSKVLSQMIQARGKVGELRIYPARGSTPLEGHAFCIRSVQSWGEDVLAFLKSHEPSL